MRTKEQIQTTVELPTTPFRRMSAADKARQLLRHEEPVHTARYAKLTTRVFPEQLEWLKAEVARFRRDHPRTPKLTVEELTRLALDYLREAQDLDGLIARYRS